FDLTAPTPNPTLADILHTIRFDLTAPAPNPTLADIPHTIRCLKAGTYRPLGGKTSLLYGQYILVIEQEGLST
ncbi:hypothetical protein PCANC_28568, partial [Puccinia coronata f. sp. avenae]